jgi:hypothetical protein
LTHSRGFANLYFQEPDRQLRIDFEPASPWAYPGDGLILSRSVPEEGLGIDVGTTMQRRLFAPNGMTRSSLIWRADFRPTWPTHSAATAVWNPTMNAAGCAATA